MCNIPLLFPYTPTMYRSAPIHSKTITTFCINVFQCYDLVKDPSGCVSSYTTKCMWYVECVLSPFVCGTSEFLFGPEHILNPCVNRA